MKNKEKYCKEIVDVCTSAYSGGFSSSNCYLEKERWANDDLQ